VSSRPALFALLLGAVVVASSPPLRAAPHRPLDGIAELDRQSEAVLELLAAGDLRRAAVIARQLTRRFPRFALGQLLHAELSALAALDRPLVSADQAWSPALIDLLLEARARLPARADPDRVDPAELPVPPRPIVQLGAHVRHLVVVDLARSALELLEVNGGVATRTRQHYVSSGSAGFDKFEEGDRKTPIGLYRITRALRDVELPELYGAGALVLDYPNAWDRHRGRTGSGIWLHGVPRARLSRSPRSSEGCVTMSNEHIATLAARLEQPDTLVWLSGGEDGSTARTASEWADARQRYRTLFREWQTERLTLREPGPAAETSAGSASFSATELAALAMLDVNEVTILEKRSHGSDGPVDLVIMDLRLDAPVATGVTLWWTRRSGGDGWTLELEDRRTAGA